MNLLWMEQKKCRLHSATPYSATTCDREHSVTEKGPVQERLGPQEGTNSSVSARKGYCKVLTLFLGDPGDRINQLFWRCGNWGSEIGGDSANRRQDRDTIPTSTLFSQPQEEVSFSLFTAGGNRPWCLCISRSFKGVITFSQSITRVPPGNKHLPFTLVSRTSLAWC